MENAGGFDGNKKSNPFGQSITRELLQQSKKELADELGGNLDGFIDKEN